MTGPMQVREATEDDVSEAVRLMGASLGEGSVPRSEAFFRWKHLQNPFGRSAMWVAEDEGGLVGLRTMLRWELRRGERGMRLVRAVDTATRPDAQGRGVFRRLTLEAVRRLTADGVAGVFNTPNPKSGAGYLSMGWHSIGRAKVFARPRLRGLLLHRRAARWEVETSEQARLDEVAEMAGWRAHRAVDELWETPKSPSYLRWRYRDVPGISYGAARHEDGAVVFRRRVRRGLHELTLCEVRWPAKPRRWLDELCAGADVVTCSGGDPELTRQLAWLGFVPVRGPVVFVRPLADGGVTAMNQCAWSIGDLELF